MPPSVSAQDGIKLKKGQEFKGLGEFTTDRSGDLSAWIETTYIYRFANGPC